MELTLKVMTGKYGGQKIKVQHEKFLIGRSDECQLRPQSEAISRQHCVIRLGDDQATVQDLGSRNGTFVNGEKITAAVPLKSGDKLSLGQLIFEIAIPAAAPPPVSTETLAATMVKSDTTAMKQPAAANGATAKTAAHGAGNGVPAPKSGLASTKQPKVKDVNDVAQRVSAKADIDEDDINDWLMDDGLESLNETRTLQLSISQMEALAAAAGDSPDDTKVSGKTKAGDSKVANKDKVYGKLPTIPKPANAAKDSREAAAEALRKMLKNR